MIRKQPNRFILILLFTIAAASTGLHAQSGRYNNQAVTWRSAMAGGGTGMNPGPASVWANPVAVYEDRFQIESHLSILPVGVHVSSLSAGFRYGSKLSLTAGLNYEGYGSFDERDTQGTLLGTFTADQKQAVFNASLRLSSRLALGYSNFSNILTVDGSVHRDSYGSIGIIISDAAGNTRISLISTEYPDQTYPRFTFAFARQLKYLPAYLGIDHYYENAFDLMNTRIALAVDPGKDLEFYGGLNFQRFNMQTQSLGEDFLSGIAVGGAYTKNDWKLYLSVYHYGGLGMSSSMGAAYFFRGKEK